ncbi:hypothetical protein [Verrucosispora sp. TAA-831]|uniref:hypothetical protein n=1 Tax=Verrucosispora sp. TAA-831 TaxID=3422227 RepID=UPI003D6DB6DB
MPKSRKATRQDFLNIVGRLVVERSGRDDESRRAFRALPPDVQGEIHGWAADDRQRLAEGVIFTD